MQSGYFENTNHKKRIIFFNSNNRIHTYILTLRTCNCANSNHVSSTSMDLLDADVKIVNDHINNRYSFVCTLLHSFVLLS